MEICSPPYSSKYFKMLDSLKEEMHYLKAELQEFQNQLCRGLEKELPY